MDVFLLEGLYNNNHTSNIIRRARMARLEDLESAVWYLDEMYVPKWAVVGKTMPLIKYSENS